jgi:uncharacterized protein (TIGR00255 family)
MKSMTGYGKASASNDDYELEFEIRSLNHRYLDLRVLLPRELNAFEPVIRDQASRRIRRGKVDIRVNFRDKRLPMLQLDQAKLSALWSLYETARKSIGSEQPTPLELVLRDDGVVVQQMPEIGGFNQLLESTLSKAVDAHQEMAEKEGDAMKTALLESLARMFTMLKTIEAEFPRYREELLNRFRTQIPELLGHALSPDDLSRIFVEVAIYVDRSDIHEEITRLNDHLHKFQGMVTSGDSIGKTLNFILQEMHREINTIGDKFNQGKVFHEIIGIKEEVEKCREMIQNVE